MFQVFYLDVAYFAMAIYACWKHMFNVANICFECFRRMFQVFHLNVAKVDLDVAYTCMLQAYVSSVLYICCKC